MVCVTCGDPATHQCHRCGATVCTLYSCSRMHTYSKHGKTEPCVYDQIKEAPVMAACTLCSLDPCPHLKIAGGTAGAPVAGAKYAPSTKPSCPSCGRVHRNIGTDNQPVCAWRTYSKAKGVDFQPFDPANVEEFARWFAAGGWSAPVKKKGVKAPATATVPVITTDPSLPIDPAETTTVTVPKFTDLEDDAPIITVPAVPSFSTAPTNKEVADALAVL